MRKTISQLEGLRDFEEWVEKDLKDQYERRAKILGDVGILKIVSSNEMGIVGVNGKEYPFPKFEEIKTMLNERQEFFNEKKEQGFTQMDVVPFAMPLDELFDVLERRLLVHYREGKLFRARKDDSEVYRPLKLDEKNPIKKEDFESFGGLDTSDDFLYDVKQGFVQYYYTGKTKKEMIDSLDKTPVPGYLVILREESFNIPRMGQGKIIGRRKQIEAGKSMDDYVQILNNIYYLLGESSQTLEGWLTLFISHLEETNEVIDDLPYDRRFTKFIGNALSRDNSFFTFSGGIEDVPDDVRDVFYVPDASFVFIFAEFPGGSSVEGGARFVVRVNSISE